jgi:hypothetical protein
MPFLATFKNGASLHCSDERAMFQQEMELGEPAVAKF